MQKCLCTRIIDCHLKFPSLLSNEKGDKILLLVNNELLQIMHNMLFEYYGYRVITIRQTEKLCNHIKHHRPDLLVVDMDIHTKLCKQVARVLKEKKIPTLLIITSEEQHNICDYLEPGRCDYVDTLTDDLTLIVEKAKRLIKNNK